MDVNGFVSMVAAQVKDARTGAAAVVLAAKEAKGAEVAEYWKSIAPEWGDRDPRGATTPTETGSGQIVDAYEGEYANSIQVESTAARVRVGSKTKIAVFLEYGTKHNEEYACAQRTVEHFNGEVSERKTNAKGQVSRPKPVGHV